MAGGMKSFDLRELIDNEEIEQVSKAAIYHGLYDQELIEEAYILHGILSNLEDIDNISQELNTQP